MPDREMIGVLVTDGVPNGCEDELTALGSIIADHYAAPVCPCPSHASSATSSSAAKTPW